MTAEEFERQYAARSGLTVEQLREAGRIVAPCDCGWEHCQGWQSTTAERLACEKAFAEWAAMIGVRFEKEREARRARQSEKD
ncbi:MAG TPA: hypothetical protein VGG62_10680 [Terracidiphilus sp.]|jgi:hypothetical protein